MKQMHYMLVVALLLAVSVPELATAQQRKAGINAAAFLKIGVGARQVALGSAVTSMGGDITNMFWNPAGIAMKDDRIQAAASYNNWIAGLAQNVLAAGYNIPDIGTLGVGFMTFGISDIPADRDVGFTDPQLSSQVIDQSNSGTYDYQDMMVQATFSRYISDNLSLGASVKYLHEKIDDQSTSAIAFDLGSVYNIGFLGWSIGARLNNLGGDFKYYDYAQPIPLTFSIGTSMTPISVGSTNVLFAVDLVKPQDGQQYYYAGTEIGVQKMFFLRGGWKFNYSWFGLAGDGIDEGTSQRAPIQTSLERGSFGAGVRVPLDEYTVTFDYAYTVFISLDAVHRFTVAFSMK